MKRNLLLLLVFVLAAAGMVSAQNLDCMGWNNPASFTSTGGPSNSQFSGAVGTKPSQAGTCGSRTTASSLGVSLTSPVTAANLATTTDNGGNSDCGASVGGSNQFRIMSASDYASGNDPLVGNNPPLPILPSSTVGNYTKSIRLGNCQISAHAEALYYDFNVSMDNSLFLINFAIVVQAPGHGPTGDPTFTIRILETTNNGATWNLLSDTMCYMVSSTPTTNGGTVVIGQNGWHSYGSSYSQIYYKDWSQVAVSLLPYYGRRVRVEITMGDCSASGHFGYCYIAGNCQPMRLSTGGCASGTSDTVTTITAPSGLDEYTWYYSRTGIIQDDGSGNLTNPNNYTQITGPGTNGNVLSVRPSYFVPAGFNSVDDSVMQQTTFLCRMKSHLDPAKPFYSYLTANVDNVKPTLSVDTIFDCDGTVTITDISTAYDPTQSSRGVDTNLTEWYFYDTPVVGRNSQVVGQATGGTASHQYSIMGNHCVRMLTYSSNDHECYTEKVVSIHSLRPPRPKIRFSRDIVCADSLVTLYDETIDTIGIGTSAQEYRSIYHRWHIFNDNFDTVIVAMPNENSIQLRLKDTVTVELTSHVNYPYYADTNRDGRLDKLFCDGTATRTLYVEAPPTLRVLGDTIVCNGRDSEVSVTANLQNCQYFWYENSRQGTQLNTTSTNILRTQPHEDKTFFVHVISENGCHSWDSLEISILKPTIAYVTKYGKPEICEGDTVKLWSSRATKYDWTADPDDNSMWNQEHADTIIVTPSSTTNYSVVGHGGSGDHDCVADPVSQKIIVRPYPELSIRTLPYCIDDDTLKGVRLTPSYIDSDNPSVQFTDSSLYHSSSYWEFGDGQNSTTPSVVHTYTDLAQDSMLVSLTSYNPLGCSRATSFWIRVSLFSVWYPNAFTPRLEENNVFKVYSSRDLVDYDLTIFDRGGAIVFQTNDPEEGWDGTCNGRECKQASYVYIATYRRPGVERLLTRKGTVTLIR